MALPHPLKTFQRLLKGFFLLQFKDTLQMRKVPLCYYVHSVCYLFKIRVEDAAVCNYVNNKPRSYCCGIIRLLVRLN